MCVCVRTCKRDLLTHLCQPATASCCPTLLLPWWTPFGLQQVHRFVCVCVSPHVCYFLFCFELMHVHFCMHVCVEVSVHIFRCECVCFLFVKCARSTWTCLCQPVFYRVHLSSAIKQWDSCGSRGVMTQLWWEEVVLVLFPSDCLLSGFLSLSLSGSYIFSHYFSTLTLMKNMGWSFKMIVIKAKSVWKKTNNYSWNYQKLVVGRWVLLNGSTMSLFIYLKQSYWDGKMFKMLIMPRSDNVLSFTTLTTSD